ncbi:MAG TPA: AAA family ATPase [Solirubrobacterales bacterium]|nr:AAA family ATPase [Solirubrobacterales bacterium]
MTATQSQEALLDAGPAAGENFEGEVRVEYVRWASEDGKFAVVDVTLADGTPLCAVGALGHLEEESRARLAGTFELHSRHGLQLAAREAEPLDPAGIDGARRYLKSLPGIGAKRADELIDRHGEDLFVAIDRDPEGEFSALKGVSAARASEAAEEWADRRAERRLYALLAPHGLARHVGELIAERGIHAAEDIREEPYSLTETAGIGFHSADRVAVACGIDPDSPERVQAAAVHALLQAENRGHTHLPLTELIGAMRELLGSEPSMGLISSAPGLEIEGTLIYRHWTLRAETWLAAALGGMARAEPAWSKPPLESEYADLTDGQREATTNALTRRLSVITGGPGTGKTHLTDALVRMADGRDLTYRLLAPTGRAARRLTVATNGAPASTIHKALEWIPGEIPGRDEDNPIDADLVIVDEASMLSLELCRALIAAIGEETHLVLVGDVDQLPPIGPGKPFCELIESGIAPTVRLDHVFRQARRSMIVTAAHSIRKGEVPRSAPGPDEIQDFYSHSRSSAEELAVNVVRIAVERIPAEFGLDPTRQVQVLAPQYKGALGIDSLHSRMREALCGSAPRCLEGRFRIGEKVITTRSLPEHEIANGTIFVIDEADDENNELTLETDLGELVTLPYREARSLRGGFCTSVHKAQGFEVPAVIVCLHSSHAPQLLSRNLLYTAVTRAQKLCVLAGDGRALHRALGNTDALDRHSRLIERLVV